MTLPAAFTFRAIGIGLFIFIENPKHIFAYAVGTWLVLGTTCEQICADCILMRNAEREIRGVIYGTSIAFGYLGQFVLCIAGGWLFDHVGPKTPFYFVGILDITFALTAAILSCCGVIENDIAKRKKQAEEIERKRAEIESDLNRGLSLTSESSEHSLDRVDSGSEGEMHHNLSLIHI